VPATVQPGDALLLVLSTNSTVNGTAPAGWTEEGRQASGSSISTQVWSRVAEAGDAGSQLTVALGGRAKVTLQLAAYSGVSSADPVATLAGKVDVGGTAHTTPTATAQAGSWVVSIWSDKQAAAHTWSAPTGVVVRDNQAGVGSGDPATLHGDSGIGLPAGTVAVRPHTTRAPGDSAGGPSRARSAPGQVVKCSRSRTMSPNASYSASVRSAQLQSLLADTVGGRLK
jgi:hypothetical protein